MDATGIEKNVILSSATGKQYDDAKACSVDIPIVRIVVRIDYAGFDQRGFGPAAIADSSAVAGRERWAWASLATKEAVVSQLGWNAPRRRAHGRRFGEMCRSRHAD